MNRCIYILSLLIVMGQFSVHAAVEQPGFSKYDLIIIRKPFGDPPPAKSAAKAEAVQQHADPFNRYHKVIGMTDDEGGVRVGVYNMRTKRSFFVKVGGETPDGITLVEADYDEGTAFFKKGDEEHTLKLSTSKGSSRPAPPNRSMRPGTRFSKSGRSSSTTSSVKVPKMVSSKSSSKSSRKRESYLERLRRRRAEMEAAKKRAIEAAAKKQLESVDREEMIRKYNLELIRAKGKKGAALPIQLTPEEDAKLVKEGVLPPNE